MGAGFLMLDAPVAVGTKDDRILGQCLLVVDIAHGTNHTAVCHLGEPANATLGLEYVVIAHLGRLGLGANLEHVVISNNHIVEQITMKGFHIENGTNSLFEFSAYKEGIDFLEDSSLLPSGVPILILNDTLFLKHNAKFFLRKIFFRPGLINFYIFARRYWSFRQLWLYIALFLSQKI